MYNILGELLLKETLWRSMIPEVAILFFSAFFSGIKRHPDLFHLKLLFYLLQVSIQLSYPMLLIYSLYLELSEDQP